MCSNCKGGFYPPVTCGGCNTGCCPGITFPCVFGASVNNPACECCKEKTPPGQCKWPCMWPCCCTCTPPKFEFKPLKPEPVCHCPSPHSHHTACGNHCLKRTCKSWKTSLRKFLKMFCSMWTLFRVPHETKLYSQGSYIQNIRRFGTHSNSLSVVWHINCLIHLERSDRVFFREISHRERKRENR